MTEKKIEATVIFEILGRPPEHITDALEKLIAEVGKEKGIEILSKQINEPKKIDVTEKQKDSNLYTSFAVVELRVEEIINLLLISFKYMPSHFEITYPEKYEIKNSDLDLILNEIVIKMHKYDEIAKTIIAEKQILENQLREIISKIKESQKPSMSFTTNVKEAKEQIGEKTNKKKTKTKKK